MRMKKPKNINIPVREARNLHISASRAKPFVKNTLDDHASNNKL